MLIRYRRVMSGTPSNATVEATSASGANVTYTAPTATDNVDGTDVVSCSPASGSTSAIGATTVSCSATDRAGNTAHSSFTVVVQDTTAPTVSVTAPSNNTTVSGSSVTIFASASDLVGVVGVQFKLDTNTNIGSEVTFAPYSIMWDSTSASYGSHTMIAVARDAAGNYATSSPITVTVNNLPLLSAGSADLYWVGGTGNWSDGHHWAITSGGVGQYNPPTTSNVVHFDANSSASSYTVTIDAAASSATTTVANPASGWPTFAGSAAWTDSGGLTLVSGMGWTYTGAMTLGATSLGNTITTAGVTLANNITFNGTSGGWTDQDNLTDGATNTITVSAGTLNLNAKT